MLWKLDGNFEESRRIFERVVKSYETYYGEVHPSTVNALINLGSVLKDLHKNEEAIVVFEKAIEGRRRSEGD